MNFYIQGDAAKAQQIKSAFEKKGIDVLDFGFADKTVVYCSIGGCVQSLPYSINLMHILYSHPDYQELELPVEPLFKVGDWIVQNDNGTVSQITKTINGKDEYGEYRAYEHTNGYFHEVFENEYHLWSIADAKDGDVFVTEDYIFIFKYILHGGVHLYCHYNIDDEEFDSDIPDAIIGNIHDKGAHFKPATKEEHILLFAKMKEAGYEWDAGKKELRKIKPHYDIDNFKPKQWVLVRDDDEWEWALTRFSYLSYGSASLFVCINGASFQQCIPFEDNEKLLGTTDMCDEQYINW